MSTKLESKRGLFEPDLLDNKSEIELWLLGLGVKNYSINSDGSIDVDGDVNMSCQNLEKIPTKFGKVTGDFYCYNNNLTSLEGAPTSVGGGFYCYKNNNLTSLEGAPTSVGGNFYCSYNNLTSLEGAPTSVGGGFYCNQNEIEFTESDVHLICNVEGNIYV